MIRRALGLVFVLLAVGGSFDPDAAEATASIAAQYAARPGFDPYRDRAPVDCAAIGKQWVAHSADAGPWIHTCLDLVLSPAELARWR